MAEFIKKFWPLVLIIGIVLFKNLRGESDSERRRRLGLVKARKTREANLKASKRKTKKKPAGTTARNRKPGKRPAGPLKGKAKQAFLDMMAKGRRKAQRERNK